MRIIITTKDSWIQHHILNLLSASGNLIAQQLDLIRQDSLLAARAITFGKSNEILNRSQWILILAVRNQFSSVHPDVSARTRARVYFGFSEIKNVCAITTRIYIKVCD